MNYFDFFNLPVSFLLDEAALKRKYYANSKKYHPDFYTLESEKKQAEILEQSTFNNQAYKTLADFDLRMKYILDLKEVLAEEGKNQIPQEFLMEMMEINESLMELEFDFDSKTYESVLLQLNQQKENAYQNIAPILEHYDDKKVTFEELKKVKNYYLKKRYLLRIRENLSKFAIR